MNWLFAGGEPLQHPKLEQFLVLARQKCFARELRLITNGVLLERLSETALECLDYVIVSLYPGVRLRHDLRAFAASAKKHHVYAGVYTRQEFRHALTNFAIANERLVLDIHRSCNLRVYCHTIYDGRYYRCPRAHTLETRMRIIGVTVCNREIDGVALHGNPNLREELAAYLNDEMPLSACRYCLGSVGARIPVVQLNRAQLVEEQSRNCDVMSLIDPDADPRDLPKPQMPDPRWVREVFEPLGEFLDRVEATGKSMDAFLSGPECVCRSKDTHTRA